MKTLIVLALALVLAPSCVAARTVERTSFDTSMLRQWTPHNRAEMQAADPVALAYLARGWRLAGDERRAEMVMDELVRRGEMAFTAGALPNLQQPKTINPANTIYTIALVQVADAFRVFGMTKPLQQAIHDLKEMPIVDNGCFAYSIPDADAGCVHDINGITMAVLSHIPGSSYEPELAYETRTQLPDGSWRMIEPRPYAEDAAHLSWTAWELLQSADPRLVTLGQKAAAFIQANYDPKTAPPFSIYAVAALEIQTGDLKDGCALAGQLPAWASSYHQTMPDGSVTVKNQMWAAFVYTWAQSYC